MFKFKAQKRGIALFIVLGTILIITILANVILNTISSQSRLTHHQVSRIQAYYAAMAGMNFGIEMLRTQQWTVNLNCPSPGGCNYNDPNFPASVQQPIQIILRPPGGPCAAPAGSSCINVNVTYTFTP